jgi:hypothetical protein
MMPIKKVVGELKLSSWFNWMVQAPLAVKKPEYLLLVQPTDPMTSMRL